MVDVENFITMERVLCFHLLDSLEGSGRHRAWRGMARTPHMIEVGHEKMNIKKRRD
jgi:hypothetical protein